ncbi:o-methyltransferase b protein [Stemphylium lycopersici]|nr:o-methyltransferase b protein [Stemphylium lycopersici]
MVCNPLTASHSANLGSVNTTLNMQQNDSSVKSAAPSPKPTNPARRAGRPRTRNHSKSTSSVENDASASLKGYATPITEHSITIPASGWMSPFAPPNMLAASDNCPNSSSSSASNTSTISGMGQSIQVLNPDDMEFTPYHQSDDDFLQNLPDLTASQCGTPKQTASCYYPISPDFHIAPELLNINFCGALWDQQRYQEYGQRGHTSTTMHLDKELPYFGLLTPDEQQSIHHPDQHQEDTSISTSSGDNIENCSYFINPKQKINRQFLQPLDDAYLSKKSCNCVSTLLDHLSTSSHPPSSSSLSSTSVALSISRRVITCCCNTMACPNECSSRPSTALVICEAIDRALLSLKLGGASLWTPAQAVPAPNYENGTSSSPSPSPSSSSTSSGNSTEIMLPSSMVDEEHEPLCCGTLPIRGADRRAVVRVLLVKRVLEVQGVLERLRDTLMSGPRSRRVREESGGEARDHETTDVAKAVSTSEGTVSGAFQTTSTMDPITVNSESFNESFDEDVAADNVLKSLESLAAGNIPASLRDDEKRLRFLEASRMASFKLEQPWDTMQRLIFCALPPNMVQVGIDMGLWRLLVKREGKAIGVSEMAAELGAQEALLVRMLRYAATQWMVEQVGVEMYRATNITRYLSMSGLESVIFHVWLANNSYKQPQDNKNLPFNLSKNTDLHFFEWLSQRPRHQEAFNEYMSFQRVGQKSWLDVFPLEKYLRDLSTGDEQRTLFADVGGGYGHQCKELLKRFPWLQGRVVLEDTHAAAIDSAKGIEGLKVVFHDFTKAQPVKGARIYYLRNILHDWPDQACHDILSQLKDALAHDSVILLDELVLQDEGAHWYGASFDLLMMANYGARERSLAEWDRILVKAGLERKVFVPYSMQGDGIQVVAVREPVHGRL